MKKIALASMLLLSGCMILKERKPSREMNTFFSTDGGSGQDIPPPHLFAPQQYDNHMVYVSDYSIEDILERSVRVDYAGVDSDFNLMRAHGSGTIVAEKDGYAYILTCNHVVTEEENAIALVHITYHDQVYLCDMVCGDAGLDVALLRTVEKVPYCPGGKVEYAKEHCVRPGDAILTVGFPSSVGETLTAGIVSQVESTAPVTWIQRYTLVDSQINPGNSGGANYVFLHGIPKLAGLSQFGTYTLDGLYGLVTAEEILTFYKNNGCEWLLE